MTREEVLRGHNCYSRGCREEQCVIAHRQHTRDQRRKMSRPDSDWLPAVSPQIVADHLAMLRAHGMTLKRILELTGCQDRTIHNIENLKVKRVFGSTAKKIMDIEPSDTDMVDAAASRSHLLWLKRRGIGIERISRVTGISQRCLQNIREGERERTDIRKQDKILSVKPHMFLNWRTQPASARYGIKPNFLLSATG